MEIFISVPGTAANIIRALQSAHIFMWPAKRIDIEAAEEAGLKIECIIIQP
jgi:hypothetical protein